MSDGPITNKRFIAYANEHGRLPVDQMAHDRARWPGGSMAGFMLWISKRIDKFGKAHPEAFCPSGTGVSLVDHEAFDAWLEDHVVEVHARLVAGCMSAGALSVGMATGLTPDDLQRMADWLRAQPAEFIERVVQRASQLPTA